ncbi:MULTISPECIES: membrane integrity-associated transporter subunit PqiA [Tenebrionibacter/Tenebrionicola group]|jgi:paraquat-inducible protein A|uniref:Membrane integrity-associated transporter subunit PqiA n=2 Tax=Tenebrionibacter/Tenebrionicola group TaxID=2969848 RepID=A0A8K0XYD7_9ENTR|nr:MULTISPECIES: membrane integrity-associated transporter subunit PqiA [Tenebrionibacter/Tenebrionicola group]MBK4716297.1 membrane integrity-associated transporter subunit PqiA [Tenebrionibacter intestinalis]MBV5097092.1 membrane integrity-associated transporter subunit PqiA [Tenebrionicola larvae]
MCEQHHASRHILCPQCDLLVALPPLTAGEKACCPRCSTTLTTQWQAPRQRPTAYALAALFMLLLANLFPFVNMKVAGVVSEITLQAIPGVMFSEDYASLGTLFVLFVQLAPATCLLGILLLVNRIPVTFRVSRVLARVLFQLKTWGMAEIFLAGVLVSFVKLMAYGDIGIGPGFLPWCLFCILQLRAFQCVDRRWLWDDLAPAPAVRQPLEAGKMGMPQGLRACLCCTAIVAAQQSVCPRCHVKGYVRRHNSLQWTLALLLTSIILYLPANLLPVMITDLLGDKMPSTILAGVVLLWSEGSYPVAMVIFIASIMVPTLKMVAIGWLCLDAKGYGRRDSERMHKIYEVVEFVGRWSMIDVFVIAVLSALVRMGALMNIYPAMGALMFALVVIVTMLAAMMFDPRLSWDRAAQSSHKELAEHGK